MRHIGVADSKAWWVETCGSIIWPSGSVPVRVHAKPAVPVPVPVLFKTDFSVPVLVIVALLKRFIILPHSTSSYIFMKKELKSIFAYLIYLAKIYFYGSSFFNDLFISYLFS